jgi:hypothetical protein
MKKDVHSTLNRFGLFIFCLVVCGVSSLVAAPGDSHWDRQFGLPGTTNKVFAMRFNGDKLYTSGIAGGPGGLLATNTGVDIFDGTNWSGFGEVSGSTCIVYDIGFLGNDIYLAGLFSRAGGLSSPGLAKWNGSDWSSVGFAGQALALASDGTNLYVGGSFTNAGGVLNTNIARFDGTNWYALGSGLGSYVSGVQGVSILELHNGLLYAGGTFTNSGSTAVSNVAVWNGSTWASLGAGSANGVNNSVSALAFQNDDLYVGGNFTAAGGASAFNVAKWSSGSWSALGVGPKGGVGCIGFLGSDIYVGGGFTNVNGVSAHGLAKWDGFSWTSFPATDGVFQYPFNDVPNRMVVKDGFLYIGGNFNEAGDVIANHVVRYDGSNFYPLGTAPANGFANPGITVTGIGQADDGIYVGGLFAAAGKTFANRIARWDGTNWNDVGGGTIGGNSGANRVIAIAGQGSDLYIGGNFYGVGSLTASNVAHWDGANWSSMGVGFDSTVGSLAASGSSVYAGGSFTNANNGFDVIAVNHIAMWDGSSWNPLGLGIMGSGTVNAIAVDSMGNVYAGGTFTSIGGVTANRVAMWNGSSWASLGSGSTNGLNNAVFAIAVNGSDVYVGGSFTTAGVTTVNGIAHWDGTNWLSLGSGVTNAGSSANVRALAFGGDGKLYCCGRFTNISGVNAGGIARWNNVKWEALGSGYTLGDGSVIQANGLAIRGNDVFSVGTFITAGIGDSSGIARWNDTMDFTPPFALNFSRTQLQPGNVFKSRLNCSAVATYLIEYSDDFQTWSPLTTNNIPQLDFTNAVSFPVTRRVFRARGLP